MPGILGVDYDSKAVHLSLLQEGKVSTFRVWLSSLTDCLRDLSILFVRLAPERIIVEAPIYIQNPKTSFALARVHTIICLACEQHGVPFTTLGSTRWKKLALGRARVTKQEVFEIMKQRFGEIVSDHHFADATGLALAGEELHDKGLL